MKARLARFYGFSPKDIASLPYGEAQGYLQSIAILDAEERLLACQVSAYPHLKQDRQRKLYNFLQKNASYKKNTGIDALEFGRMLSGRKDNTTN